MVALTPEQQHSVEQRFSDLAGRWTELIAYRSNTNALRDHPVRREIINMGDSAVPLILKEVEREPDVSWFGMLAEITGADPVPDAAAGRVGAMAKAWIHWGRERGRLA